MARRVTCDDCGTVLTVVDRDARTVYVETDGRLPTECCQRAATTEHTKVGIFHARGSAPVAPERVEAP
jgi:hypothetical protein